MDRERKRRTEDEMREALNRFCQAAWGPARRGEMHIFSIPLQDNDADMILMDAIDELIEARKIIASLKSNEEG
jgi:hypothetical protein